MSESTIEQVAAVNKIDKLKKEYTLLSKSLQVSYMNTPEENNSVRNFLKGKIDAYEDILKRL